MKKLKGQGVLTKWLTSKVASHQKSKFSKYITKLKNLQLLYARIKNHRYINISVVSFSSNSDFSEQVLSILTFLKYIGTPTSWTVYSDNSHTKEQEELLVSTFTFLKLITTNFDKSFVEKNIKRDLIPYRSHLFDYANKSPMGKKLFLYLNHDIKLPTLFIDSDILFYSKASCLRDLIKENANGWFLPDAEWGNLDSRYMAENGSKHYQVNSGFMLINQELNLSKGLNFLSKIEGVYQYFSEQTVMHILLLENNFMPLDPRIFTLNSGDQFDFNYLYSKKDIAIRHYTGPVRHKMWQRNWKWHLSL